MSCYRFDGSEPRACNGHTVANVRGDELLRALLERLEGAFATLLALSARESLPLTIPLLEEALKDLTAARTTARPRQH